MWEEDEPRSRCWTTASRSLHGSKHRWLKVGLERACPPGLHGRCDPLQLGRVLSNLVGNGVRHTPPGRRAAWWKRADGVEVSVERRRRGLPPGAGERVFQRFWRADERRGAGGTGLGLRHRARNRRTPRRRIRVTEAPGGGACSTFRSQPEYVLVTRQLAPV